ncbi:ankyrin repeat domain-containing protein [Pseudomonas sp. sp1636]|uniref:formyltransferase family protein n=1 Tax=Pseudomonas sp. sp1636 TaxID=3036707 RepID=UPI0025A57D81|nr:formyltransferase family protein [Pseudomonas sp. sp1636]MDM8349799.1 ankyrin repeat domain-containing protein [Pseudomonas sp. sp1636]
MIVIAGKNNIAVHGLELALKYFDRNEIIAIVNANDTGEDGWQRSLLGFAKSNKVSIKTLEEVYDLDVDIFLSLEFDKIVRPEKIQTSKIYNIHFSLLPKYKGMYTSVWPIIYGDQSSGVTLHRIDRGIDTGDVIAQKSFILNRSDRSQDCYRKYIEASKLLLEENFSLLISDNEIIARPQPATMSSYFAKQSVDFSKLSIDLRKTAWQIQRQVYAYSFRPYQLLNFNGKAISDVLISDRKSEAPSGTVVEYLDDRFVVATIDYDVELIFDDFDSQISILPSMDVADLSECILKMLGVSDRNRNGWSPIIVAAYHGRLDLVEWLLDNGADVNDVNYNGTTVLMYAKDFSLKNNNSEMVRFLLKKGARPELKDYKGKTVMEYINASEAEFLGLS